MSAESSTQPEGRVQRRSLLLVGAGGCARDVVQIVRDLNAQHPDSPPWQLLAFAVEARYARAGETLGGLPVMAIADALARHPNAWWNVAVGAPALRRRLAQTLSKHVGERWATLVHPTAWCGSPVQLGPGTVVGAGCQLTTDIRIGAHAHINIGCTISHDANFGDFVTLSPGVHVAGNVHLAMGAELGTGSVIAPRVTVGAWTILGAGSVTTRPLPPDVTAVGVPSRIIKTRPAGWHEGGG